jgi:hypothetical protein
MRKVKLNLARLKVESFDTSHVTGERGTVQAHAPYTYYCGTYEEGCSGYVTCGGGTWCGPCATEPRGCFDW